jgi:hypothetical protein
MAVVRYLVDDVDAAIAFYTDRLGFSSSVGWARSGGQQIVLDDAAGNPVEVFQPE